MRSKERISKASWNLVESSKDAATTNITNAVRAGKLKIEATSLPLLLTLIGASIDEGFHRGHKSFMKTVDKALDDESMPPMTKVSEKKVTKVA